MSAAETEAAVCAMLAEHSCRANVALTDSLADNLDFDSLDLIELLVNLEERFDISLADEAFEGARTVADVAEVVATAVAAKERADG